MFSSSQVASILGIKLWKLNRLLSHYMLKSSGSLGQGRGSRRIFNEEDVRQIAIVMFLNRDGFTPKLVNKMQQTSVEDLVAQAVELSYKLNLSAIAPAEK